MSTSHQVIPMEPKLLGSENWLIWKEKIRNALDARGLLDIVDGIETCPSEAATTTPALKDAETASQVTTSPSLWDRRNAMACSQIMLNISDEEIPITMGLKSAKAVWDALHKRFESTSTLSLTLALADFYEKKFLAGNDLRAHLNKLKMLHSILDPSWPHIIETIDISKTDSDSTIARLLSILEARDDKPQDRLTPENADSAHRISPPELIRHSAHMPLGFYGL
ncbi:hypothetical protein GLOTRDRAFT_133164 [Gloeophyllum trabeum ATCC 11539]|uniref:Retrotransposon Copia-like N-terminal domain-containing protein n=1 Tax=Gloeophyllum trabeum (strain ATCC 11539 / FP-39264 / Madison 617) TaxID=670483 RepID=S7RFJ5_GLOTA|nr:uncharacterized protein GLOTRDRAFT_133164 [Gloeophyllum trabeum ATCC 11539]EPQ51289.1 hypothetical protein GLOTRDRAFT_133164 [Gloeophyllum trabeum ATCC 11539]